MSVRTSAISLTRRLVGQYLAFGFACLFFCFATALLFQFRGRLPALAPMIALVSVGILVAGAVVMYRTVTLCSAVEEQLTRISRQSRDAQLPVQRISAKDPAAEGWNALIERLSNHDAWSRIEDRLSAAVEESRDGCFQQLFQQLPIGIALTGADGEIGRANGVLVGLAECQSEAELIGQPLAEALRLQSAANADEVNEKLRRSASGAHIDARMGARIEDGVLRLRRYPLLAGDGEPTRHVWVVDDVTQQLLSAEARNQFVFTATHELRTPLANLKAYADLLSIEDGIEVEKQKEFCNIINAEATRLARFVDDLLNISQMESGALSLQKRDADLETLIQDVVEHLQPELEQKGIELQCHFPAKWPKSRIDKDKVESALINLLGNAAKYTPSGGKVKLDVEIDESTASIHVEDTGIGVAEDELANIFQTFFRSEDERVRAVSGNGLGLAFALEVAKLHGGRLTVASELDKGSRFSLVLPLT